MDKGEFVKRDFTVTPTGNGGVIAYLTRPVNEQDRGSVANPSDRVSFTTPVDFIEWLKGEYGVDTQITNVQEVDTWGDELNADASGPYVGAAAAKECRQEDGRKQGKREPVWKPLTPDPHGPRYGDHRDNSCDGSVECGVVSRASALGSYVKEEREKRQGVPGSPEKPITWENIKAEISAALAWR